jgi:type 1 fimbria pilin
MKHLFISLATMLASTTAASAATQVELNGLSQEGPACRLTFTVNSAEGHKALATQTVLFDSSGAVKLLTVFDFGDVPHNGLRVRQFDIPATPCSDVAVMLINGIERCETANGTACAAPPQFTSRVKALEVKQ